MYGAVMRRGWILGATAYVALRVALVIGFPPTSSNDTAGYADINFIGAAHRPWVLPLLFSATTDRSFVMLQTIVSAVAFVVLAAAINSTIRHRYVRAAAIAAVLLIGATPRITMWDAVLMTESLAVSLTALLIAAAVWFERVPAWAFGALFVAWVFLRDAHAYLAVMVCAAAVPMLWRRTARPLAVVLLAVTAWGLFAAQNNDAVETYNVTSNIAHRATLDDGMMRWFLDHGMPSSAAFSIDGDGFDIKRELLADDDFQAWATEDGPTTYARYLLTHPAFTARGLTTLIMDDDVVFESMSDETFYPYTSPRGQWLSFAWPAEGSRFTVLLVVVAAVGAAAVASTRRLDRRWILPAAIAASTPLHALLVYHGAPIEVARHALVLIWALVIASGWMIALAVDALLEPTVSLRGGLDHTAVAVGEFSGDDERVSDHAVPVRAVL